MSKLIVFQGDSITDSGRNFESTIFEGYGYVTMVKGLLGLEYPEKFSFMNKGISGNRIVDVYARIKSDIINLKPDYLSILIGVNDVWHEFSRKNGVATEKFEKIYSMLIEEIKEVLPDIKIMILEPFVLKGSATVSNDKCEDLYPHFRKEVEEKAKAAKRIAEKFSLPFVSLQEKFDEVYNSDFPDYWVRDGVHPTAPGHMLIAREWVKAFKELIKE